MPTSGPNSVIYDATVDDTYGALLGFIGGKQAAEWSGESWGLLYYFKNI